MAIPLPSRFLPPQPDIDQLRRQAKELLQGVAAGDAAALAEAARYYHDLDPARFALHDAQLVIARTYGFESWPKLRAHVEGVTVRRLVEAVRHGDLDRVRAMLRARPELVNTAVAGNDDRTALHHAVLTRQPEMVRLLMTSGADARAGIGPHAAATGALTMAAERGYGEIEGIIRAAEARRPQGSEPDAIPADLVAACRAGDAAAAIARLAAQPDPLRLREARSGWTALHLMAAWLLPEAVGWLLERGADVRATANDGSTPLDVLGRRADRERRSTGMGPVAALLRARGAPVTPRAAVILGDAQAVRHHHAGGALEQPLDDWGGLLRLAVEYERSEMLELLLDLGLDPDARVRVQGLEEVVFTWGMPLQHCAITGRHAMAEMLLARGADPNGQVYASGTPVSEAHGQRDAAMVALLERYGGRTLPSMAGLYRRPDLARRLLAEHGDTPLPDDGFSKGPVAEQLVGAAARGGDPETLELALARIDWPAGDRRWLGVLVAPLGLWNHGTGPWCHPDWDRTTYLTCLRRLLERSGPPTGTLRFGLTLLHELVASRPHITAADRLAFGTVLLDAGASLDARDELLLSTPLGWACRWGREELVRLFLERGADPVEAGAQPWATPLAWAEKMGHAGIAAVLRPHIRPS